VTAACTVHVHVHCRPRCVRIKAETLLRSCACACRRAESLRESRESDGFIIVRCSNACARRTDFAVAKTRRPRVVYKPIYLRADYSRACACARRHTCARNKSGTRPPPQKTTHRTRKLSPDKNEFSFGRQRSRAILSFYLLYLIFSSFSISSSSSSSFVLFFCSPPSRCTRRSYSNVRLPLPGGPVLTREHA